MIAKRSRRSSSVSSSGPTSVGMNLQDIDNRFDASLIIIPVFVSVCVLAAISCNESDSTCNCFTSVSQKEVKYGESAVKEFRTVQFVSLLLSVLRLLVADAALVTRSATCGLGVLLSLLLLGFVVVLRFDFIAGRGEGSSACGIGGASSGDVSGVDMTVYSSYWLC